MRRNRISKQAQRRMSCAAVVPAAGASSRMGGQDKLFCELGGFLCSPGLCCAWSAVRRWMKS